MLGERISFGGGKLNLPGHQAEGDIIVYENGSWKHYHIGADGQILTVSGGYPAWAYAEPSSNLRHGKLALTEGAFRYTVNFETELPDNSYTLTTSLINNVDTPVSVYSYTITNTTTSGFDMEFSGTIDSNNFVVHWIVML